MSHFSPPVYLVWVTLFSGLGVFYIYHLWQFDRFQCLNISRMSRNGAFMRVMAYTYLAALPMFLTYSVCLTVIKYEEGYVLMPSGAVFPKPIELWSPNHQSLVQPLNIIFSIAWALEVTTHLEELCFWLFLIRSGPSPISWFKSMYFKIWFAGSIFSFILVPLVTYATRSDVLKNEAWLQLSGSTIDLIITVGFLPVLWMFRGFLQKVRDEGADKETVMRLAKFHDLNISRTFFRFMFVVPLFMLSIDGLQQHSHTLNENLWSSEFLTVLASVGCVLQGALTLLIFFPRNIELETRRWLRPPGKPRRTRYPPKSKRVSDPFSDTPDLVHGRTNYHFTNESSVQNPVPMYASPGDQPIHTSGTHNNYSMSSLDGQKQWSTDDSSELTPETMHSQPCALTLNPHVHSYTSPINFDPTDFPPRL